MTPSPFRPNHPGFEYCLGILQSEKEPLEVDRKHQSQYFKEYSNGMTEALLRFDLILLRLTLYGNIFRTVFRRRL